MSPTKSEPAAKDADTASIQSRRRSQGSRSSLTLSAGGESAQVKPLDDGCVPGCTCPCSSRRGSDTPPPSEQEQKKKTKKQTEDAPASQKSDDDDDDVECTCPCLAFYSQYLGPTADEPLLNTISLLMKLCGNATACGCQCNEDAECGGKENLKPSNETLAGNATKSRSEKLTTYESVKTSCYPRASNVRTVDFRGQTCRRCCISSCQAVTKTCCQNCQTMCCSIPCCVQCETALFAVGLNTDATLNQSEQTQVLPDQESQLVQTSPNLTTEMLQFTPDTDEITLQTDVNNNEHVCLQCELNTANAGIDAVPSMEHNRQQTDGLVSFCDEGSQAALKREEKSKKRCKCRKSQSSGTGEGGMTNQRADEHICICPQAPSLPMCHCCKYSSSSSGVTKSCVCTFRKSSTCECSTSSTRSTKSRKSIHSVTRHDVSKKSLPNATGNPGEYPCPDEVRYAVTKISKFKDFTTYEVMKSTRNQPNSLPKRSEGVFVVKKAKKDNKQKRH